MCDVFFCGLLGDWYDRGWSLFPRRQDGFQGDHGQPAPSRQVYRAGHTPQLLRQSYTFLWVPVTFSLNIVSKLYFDATANFFLILSCHKTCQKWWHRIQICLAIIFVCCFRVMVMSILCFALVFCIFALLLSSFIGFIAVELFFSCFTFFNLFLI